VLGGGLWGDEGEGGLPLGFEVELFDSGIEKGLIKVLLFNHPCNITKVALMAGFLIKSKFMDDYIFRGSDSNITSSGLRLASVCKCPSEAGMIAREIDVCLQSGLMVDDIKVTIRFTPGFDGDYFCRRQVKLFLWEKFHKFLNLMWIWEDDKIDV